MRFCLYAKPKLSFLLVSNGENSVDIFFMLENLGCEFWDQIGRRFIFWDTAAWLLLVVVTAVRVVMNRSNFIPVVFPLCSEQFVLTPLSFSCIFHVVTELRTLSFAFFRPFFIFLSCFSITASFYTWMKFTLYFVHELSFSSVESVFVYL